MTSRLGLRERKKAATRATLSHAAWSMMLRYGLDAVTPEAVAEVAEVSPRTFRNYFASREEAIFDELAQRHLALADKIRARPADEPLWDSLVAVLPQAVTEIVGNRSDFAVLTAVITESPSMLAQNLLVFERGGQLIADVIAERTGTDAGRDVAPHLLAGTVCVAIRTSLSMWVNGATGMALPDLIRGCLEQLRAGLPVGTTPPQPAAGEHALC